MNLTSSEENASIIGWYRPSRSHCGATSRGKTPSMTLEPSDARYLAST